MTYDTIDATDWKEQGDDLKLAILNAVRDTQRYIVRELPNKLVLRPDQYDMLQDDPYMTKFYKSNEQVYITPENAMDVIIKQ